jgi:Tfp pilus assembly protein PilN
MRAGQRRVEQVARKRTAFACVSIALLGSLVAVSWGEGRIAERSLANDALAAQIAAANAQLANAPALEAQQLELRRRIRRTAGGSNAAQPVARFLRDTSRAATARRVVVTALAADGAPVTAAVSANERNAPAAGLPFQLSLEGEYRDVLTALRELSDLGVPARLDLTSLVRTNPEGPRARLTATLRVVLDDFTTPGFDDARTAPI